MVLGPVYEESHQFREHCRWGYGYPGTVHVDPVWRVGHG